MEEIREEYEGLCGRLANVGVYYSLKEAENSFDTLINSGKYGSPEEAVNKVEAVVELVEGLEIAKKSILEEIPNYNALRTLVDIGVYGSMESAMSADAWFRAVEKRGIGLC